MSRTEPVLVIRLFPELLRELLDMLSSLTDEEWESSTSCPGWSVKDLAAHILGGEVGVLSRERDWFQTSWIRASQWEELVTLINEQNELWVAALRRLSPSILCEMLGSFGSQVCQHFATSDPYSIGPVVSWVGPEPGPLWLHLAREYTERWHHQQQIREAVGRPLQIQRDYFGPVLATFIYALPRAYSGLVAPEGTVVKLSILGDAGGDWYLVRGPSSWNLGEPATVPEAQVVIDQLDAWKLFTRSLAKEEVLPRVQVQGSSNLALRALDTVSVIA